MRHRLATWMLISLTCWTAAAQAEAPAAAPAKPAGVQPHVAAKPAGVQPRVAPKPAVAKPRATTKATAQAKAATSKPGAKPLAAAKPKAEAGPRQLQDIHIEGEIPVPQVLFISAREQRRFTDFQHRRYLRTSQEMGEQTVFPARIAVVGQPPIEARKETSP